MDVISALEQSYDQTAKLVAGLTPAELDAPSPCAGWDVRATLNHLLGHHVDVHPGQPGPDCRRRRWRRHR